MNYDPKSSHAEKFTHHGEVKETLAYGETNSTNRELIDETLARVRERRGLTHREAMVLPDCGLGDKNQETYELTEQIKRDFYGNRIVLFAPLYLPSYYINGYVCYPYHAKNRYIPRRELTQDKIRREVMVLQDMGHKRLALETGKDPVHNPIEHMLESIDIICGIKHKSGVIRHINVNTAVTMMENYRKFKDAGIGIYILFQETYHKESYKKLHPTGPEHDYCYYTEAVDRAQMGSIDDVDYSVLLDLELYRYEFAGLLMHMEHLEAVFGVGPHTISVLRIRRVDSIDPDSFDSRIDDDIFARLVVCIRIAVPYIGMIVPTRESRKIRERVLYLGISRISGNSKTSVGGYFEPGPEDECSAQFDASDNRTLDQVIDWLMDMGYVLGFRTVCYREGHTGDRFMSLCKSGQIQSCCHPNALVTSKEYPMDYSSEETRRVGEALMEKKIGSIPKEKMRQIVRDNLVEIEQGVRDSRL